MSMTWGISWRTVMSKQKETRYDKLKRERRFVVVPVDSRKLNHLLYAILSTIRNEA